MGFLEGLPTQPSVDSVSGDTRLIRRALLVYEGEFMAMDGEVKVSREDLERVVNTHNALILHRSTLAGGLDPMNLPMKDYPPLQLDHSNSARDTVGRLVGLIELGPYIRQDSKEVLAIYGNVCFLGAENCEKANDGRYTHLSVGVDFEKGLFSELTVTPFPAASEASLLSRFGDGYKKKEVSYKGFKFEVIGDEGGRWFAFFGYKEFAGGSEQEVVGKVRAYIDKEQLSEPGENKEATKLSEGEKLDKKVKMSSVYVGKGKSRTVYYFENGNIYDEDGNHVGKAPNVEAAKKFVEENWSSLSKGEEMNEELKKRLKKHLTEEKKMSEEDAEKHLAHLSSDEGEEEMSKLSAEVEEHDKKLAAEEEEKSKLAAEEKEEKLKKMAAAKDSITRLTSDFRSAFEGSQLAAKKGRILTRLSKLRAEAKITPAEVKKIELDKLSAQTEATIEAVLKTYEDREPVIQTGALGSIKAEEIHGLSKQVRMSRLEEETRANMSLLSKKDKKDGKDGVRRLSKMEDVNVHIDTTPHNHYDLSAEEAEIGRLMDEGKKEEAKLKMRECLKKALSYGSSSGAAAQLSSEETEKQLSALAEATKKMQTSYEELQKLTASLVGT